MKPLSLVVVGAGPRAISLLEWLDRLALPGQAERLRVTVVDPFPPGGRVWRTDQPDCLLMNTIAEESSVFADRSVLGVEGAVGPTLYQWAQSVRHEETVPAWVRQEASQLRGEAYATRRLFAAYLGWGFGLLCDRLRGRVEVTYVQGEVTRVTREGSLQRLTLDGGNEMHAELVVCLPGHTGVRPSPAQAELAECAAAYGLVYGPPSHPTESPVEQVEPGSAVILRGLALNFHDVLAMLTTARGGTFTEADGRLVYRPSGQEPVIYCGSRHGLPQYSRIDRVDWEPRFRVFTEDVLMELLERSPQLAVGRDLYPLVAKEATLGYYVRMAQLNGHGEVDWGALVRALEPVAPHTPDWDEILKREVPAPLRLGSLLDLARPLAGRSFLSVSELDAWMVDHLDDDISVASNPRLHARAAVPVVLRDLRWRLAGLFAVGGVSGRSYESDVDGWFGDLLRTLSNGPPVVRTRELAALCRAGIVHFVGGGMEVSCGPDGFELRTPNLPGQMVRAGALIDCYVQRQDLRRTSDPLLGNLMSSGQIRPASRLNSPEGDDSTQIGAVDVVIDTGQVIAADGSVDASLRFGGIPLEGLRWNTALAGRTGVDSGFFRETRDLARAVLVELSARDHTGAAKE